MKTPLTNLAVELNLKEKEDTGMVPEVASLEEGRYHAGPISVIEQMVARACKDYCRLVESGLVVRDKTVKPWKVTKVLDGDYRTEAEAIQLISWLKDGCLQECLNVGDLNVDASYLLKKIGLAF